MKRLKKITAILLALAMVLGLAVTAFAAASAPTYSITVTPNDTATHTYGAFQVFKGNLRETSDGFVLSDIEWGDSITDPSELITALTNEKGFEGKFAGKSTAAEIAEVLGDEKFSEDMVALFADVVGKHIATKGTKAIKDATGTAEDGGVVIDKLVPGYYFVQDQSAPLPDSEKNPGAYTEYILQLLGDITLTSKSDVPEVHKDIIDKDKLSENPNEENRVKSNTANVGDTITYELTSEVPDMKGYKDYYFVFEDTLSKGLTFDGESSVTIKIGETSLTLGQKNDVIVTKKGNKFYVTTEDLGTDGTKIRIVIHDFLQYAGQKGADIVVRYTATLNENAVILGEGNPNDVKLEFSNNPNAEFDNDKDEYEPDEPKGETPKEEVRTYTGRINVEKIDKKTGNKLAGAKFQIQGYSIQKVLVKGYDYKLHDSSDGTKGEYYKLADGTYTKEEPNTTQTNANNEKLYSSTSDTYDLVEIDKIEDKTSYMDATDASAFVDTEGKLTFEGINDGIYVVTEVIAPEGYNKIKGCYVVVVDSNPTEDSCTWNFWYKEYDTVKEISDIDSAKALYNEVKKDDNLYKFQENKDVTELTFKVENSKGIQLPETGGIGTTIFYIVGGGLLIAALAVLVSKILGSSKKSKKTSAAAQNI